MKILMTLVLLVSLSSICLAGNKAEHEAWEKKALAKELRRAKEAQTYMGNTERFEKKYGWAKEKLGDKFDDLLKAAKKSKQAWIAVAEKAENAKSHTELAELKEVAYNADEATYLAEITLKLSAGSLDRDRMIEKSGNDKDVKKFVEELGKTEKQLIEANRAKIEASKALRKAERENRANHKKLKEAYEKARSAKHAGGHSKKK